MKNKELSAGKKAALYRSRQLTEVEWIPDDGVHFKVCFKNKYGVWTHTMIKI